MNEPVGVRSTRLPKNLWNLVIHGKRKERYHQFEREIRYMRWMKVFTGFTRLCISMKRCVFTLLTLNIMAHDESVGVYVVLNSSNEYVLMGFTYSNQSDHSVNTENTGMQSFELQVLYTYCISCWNVQFMMNQCVNVIVNAHATAWYSSCCSHVWIVRVCAYACGKVQTNSSNTLHIRTAHEIWSW